MFYNGYQNKKKIRFDIGIFVDAALYNPKTKCNILLQRLTPQELQLIKQANGGHGAKSNPEFCCYTEETNELEIYPVATKRVQIKVRYHSPIKEI